MSAAGLETADARLVVERVASGLSLADVARHLSDEPALVVFAGRWDARGAVIASEPGELLVDDGDPFAALDRSMPVVDRTTGAVGGGWMGYLGYGVGRLVERLRPRWRPAARLSEALIRRCVRRSGPG
jgi:para-aminobenzoate synthetase/4-amino-4-deoxychorismate lyase